MGFTKTLRLDAFQTLGTTEPVEVTAVYAATAYGSKEKIGRSYLVKSGYGDTIRVKIYGNQTTLSQRMLLNYKRAKIAPLVTFNGLTGRISTDKNGKPIICGEAQSIALVTPPPPTRQETTEAYSREIEALLREMEAEEEASEGRLDL